uniref:Uncharacterized protein n=1 Tax=Janibacter limosus TaxID=53458 RepID=A0AC61U5S1_9MICO|nr:hypothetical protein [Janibacter limosus]
MVSRWAKGVQDEGGPVSVAVLDLNGVLCANGYRANINGAEVYVDRVHFARQGAQLVWTRLAPEIVTAWNFRDA